MFSFIDARDFLYQQKEEKKDRHNELIQIDYLLKCLEIFVFVFVCKFKLIDKKRLEQTKALTARLPKNYSSIATLTTATKSRRFGRGGSKEA